MWIVKKIKSMLSYFGLYQKNANLIFLGLDNAGKTTLLQRLKDDRMVQHEPTIHPHSEELIIGSVRFRTYDLGGHELARRIWSQYLATVDGVVFMIDASDRARFELSKLELDKLMVTEELKKVPFCVFGNKIDKRDAASEEEIRQALGLTMPEIYSYNQQGRQIEVFMCSVYKKVGYAEGFNWITQFLE